MLKRGESPFLECSSRGDKRFSPFFAYIKGYTKSIEDLYQGAKIFQDGKTNLNWKEAKGKKCINPDEVRELYDFLWEQYIIENPELQDVLVKQSGLSDMFGTEGGVCKADTLWRIRKKIIDGTLER